MRETIKRFYDLGIYCDDQVAQLVAAGAITPEDYAYITGKPYDGGAISASSKDYEASLREPGVDV